MRSPVWETWAAGEWRTHLCRVGASLSRERAAARERSNEVASGGSSSESSSCGMPQGTGVDWDGSRRALLAVHAPVTPAPPKNPGSERGGVPRFRAGVEGIGSGADLRCGMHVMRERWKRSLRATFDMALQNLGLLNFVFARVHTVLLLERCLTLLGDTFGGHCYWCACVSATHYNLLGKFVSAQV